MFIYNNNDIDTISNIQNEALKIYGKYELDKSMIWMMEEFGELVQAIRKNKDKKHIQEELGDLVAWVFCLSNILDIDLSEAIKGTFIKEIDRQLRTYNRMKYCKTLDSVEILWLLYMVLNILEMSYKTGQVLLPVLFGFLLRGQSLNELNCMLK